MEEDGKTTNQPGDTFKKLKQIPFSDMCNRYTEWWHDHGVRLNNNDFFLEREKMFQTYAWTWEEFSPKFYYPTLR